MDRDTRNAIERATQRARKLLEEDFAVQLEGDFDVHRDGAVAAKAGGHLSARQAFQRERIVAAIEHKRAAGLNPADSVADYLRDAAFTTLNRFIALKMLEARELAQECLTKGEQSGGYREFCGMAPGLALLPDGAGYRLYIESLFDELSTEVKVLFDRRDPSSVLWPRRTTFEQLLEILNATELVRVWGEDETIGWVYQFFNGHDERKKMREESQAPRNSRELAVRNQFFTPRYVVQFLTDNTLGRIWYEMRATMTALADKCEYMVRKPGEEISPRAKKDPRDLRVLDPACGSGHFLLYAFDLLIAIYEEAYADSESPKSEATGKTLGEDYPSLNALRKAVPGLVLAHNLYGVDIDPRCAQIAQLALWMRAQKAYRDFGIGRAERAQIRRSNIVVAEPLVADDQIVKEFVANLGDASLGQVFTSLVESLNLAGELGLLLRVERLVARQAVRGQTGDLFDPSEERIRTALAQFVSDEGGRVSTRRRLFADEAAYGVALLGVAEKKFDAVVMNPPFGAGSARAKQEFEQSYSRTKNDIYAAFVERGIELLAPRGRVGAITSRAGFFLASFQSWRSDIVLSEAPPVVVADLGNGVMDGAMVEAAAYCLERRLSGRDGITVFFRLLKEKNKASALLSAVQRLESGSRDGIFEVRPDTFSVIPKSPFAYWASSRQLELFASLEPFEASGRAARVGVATLDNFRFLRLNWELGDAARGARWCPYAKGGAFSPYYGSIHLVLKWDQDGRELKQYVEQKVGSASRKVQATEFYFRPGITWPSRTQSGFAPRVLPEGCVFDTKGNSAFVLGNDATEILSFLALFTSSAFKSLVDLQMSFGAYEVGVVQRTPVPKLSDADTRELADLARRGWSLKRSLDTTSEASHAFLLPLILNERLTRLDGDSVVRELDRLGQQIDQTAFRLYGIDPIDSATTAPLGEVSSEDAVEEEGDEDSDGLILDEATVSSGTDAVRSWLVGVSFGRFDPRIATGVRAIPSEPEPFAPMPRRSPGMYPEDEHPSDRRDILVDDEGHADDLVARLYSIAERVRVDVPQSLRLWLAKEFFPLHIKMYSKSRRKAPIYWQLATPSASYSVWLYIHAFNKDTLFRVQHDYAVSKLAHEERRLESVINELREKATAIQRKELAAQEAFVEELRTFVEELKRVAPLWNPNLDDGVIVNFAPLWRLVPQNKSWQKELKATWDALCDGKYDWSHVAMHLWPERVVPKCAKDQSLAIAHGLEDVFWVKATGNKWTARKPPTRSIDELVRERTSPAVKSALRSLLEAAAASGGPGRGRRGRRGATVAGVGESA